MWGMSCRVVYSKCPHSMPHWYLTPHWFLQPFLWRARRESCEDIRTAAWLESPSCIIIQMLRRRMSCKKQRKNTHRIGPTLLIPSSPFRSRSIIHVAGWVATFLHLRHIILFRGGSCGGGVALCEWYGTDLNFIIIKLSLCLCLCGCV